MSAVHLVIGVGVMVSSLVAGAIGAWAWWRVEPPPASFWPLLRASQAILLVQVLLGGLLLATGHEPAPLHVLYGLLPVGIAFVAEQLRVASAETILDQRGIENAQAVGALPREEQQSVILAIVRRETGVMAAGALVVFLLALRAGAVSGHLPL